MKEVLLNDYFRIEPLVHDTFVVNDKLTYNEMGKIVGMPDVWQRERPEWMGGVAYFDSYICKRYPVVGGRPDEAEWFVPLTEIVKIQLDAP